LEKQSQEELQWNGMVLDLAESIIFLLENKLLKIYGFKCGRDKWGSTLDASANHACLTRQSSKN
jgi:hypothetical protein